LKNRGTILFFVFLMFLSLAIPASFKVKDKATNYFAEREKEKQKEKERQLQLEEEKKQFAARKRTIDETIATMEQVADQILSNKDENGNLIQDVDVQLKDPWGSNFIVVFPNEKQVTVKSLSFDKVESADDLSFNKEIKEEKPGFVRSLINKFK
jgi:hypothetical protein